MPSEGPKSAEVRSITKQVMSKMHVNAYEHTNFRYFYFSCLVSSFLGLFVGSIIEEAIVTIEGRFPATSRIRCGVLLVIQLSIIAMALHIGNTTPFIRRYLYFDDWLMGTFAGFLFALTFINVQSALSTHMTCFAFGRLP